MKYFLIVAFFSFFYFGCSEKAETPVKGKLTVYADEGLYTLVSALADSFKSVYKAADIKVISVQAREGIVKIINGETEIFVSSREFNDEEKKAARANKLEYKTAKFCYDGIYAITGYRSERDTLSFQSIRLLLSGSDSKYKAVIPGANSGVYEFLKYKINNGADPSGAEILKSESEILKSVEKDAAKIGFISANTLQDSTNFTIMKMGVPGSNGNVTEYLEPHPGYYVQDLYPMTRLCVIYLSESGIGLASGFTSYLTGNFGQKFVLDNKLGPAAVPVKVVR